MANLIRGLSENGGVVFCGVDSTEIVRKAEKLHTTSATCSAALGRLLTGATLMGSMLKDDRDRITLRVAGGGPAGVLIACTDGTGNVKGCIDNPLVELPAKANGHLDVGTAVGKDGVLTEGLNGLLPVCKCIGKLMQRRYILKENIMIMQEERRRRLLR